MLFASSSGVSRVEPVSDRSKGVDLEVDKGVGRDDVGRNGIREKHEGKRTEKRLHKITPQEV